MPVTKQKPSVLSAAPAAVAGAADLYLKIRPLCFYLLLKADQFFIGDFPGTVLLHGLGLSHVLGSFV